MFGTKRMIFEHESSPFMSNYSSLSVTPPHILEINFVDVSQLPDGEYSEVGAAPTGVSPTLPLLALP